MFQHCRPVRLVAAVVLLFALTATAIGQQSPQLTPTPASAPASASPAAPAMTPTPAQTHQMVKVMKSLSRYDEGTKLDIRLNDGSHEIGKVSETRSTYFVFADSVSGKTRTIDYLDVESIRPMGKGSLARQFDKSANGHSGVVIGTVVVFAVLGVIAILAATHK
jgi:hypothetical protein